LTIERCIASTMADTGRHGMPDVTWTGSKGGVMKDLCARYKTDEHGYRHDC